MAKRYKEEIRVVIKEEATNWRSQKKETGRGKSKSIKEKGLRGVEEEAVDFGTYERYWGKNEEKRWVCQSRKSKIQTSEEGEKYVWKA